MKYLDLCNPIYKTRGNSVVGRFDDKIERIHKEAGGEKEEEGSKGDYGGDDNAGEGDEREGGAYLEDAFDDDEIYGSIASGQGTTTNNAKNNAKDNDAEEGLMVGIPQFWVCVMGHMEAVAKLITERDIDCIENLADVTC